MFRNRFIILLLLQIKSFAPTIRGNSYSYWLFFSYLFPHQFPESNISVHQFGIEFNASFNVAFSQGTHFFIHLCLIIDSCEILKLRCFHYSLLNVQRLRLTRYCITHLNNLAPTCLHQQVLCSTLFYNLQLHAKADYFESFSIQILQKVQWYM